MTTPLVPEASLPAIPDGLQPTTTVTHTRPVREARARGKGSSASALTAENSLTPVSSIPTTAPASEDLTIRMTSARALGLEVPDDPNAGSAAARIDRGARNQLALAKQVYILRDEFRTLRDSSPQSPSNITASAKADAVSQRLDNLSSFISPNDASSLQELIQRALRLEFKTLLAAAIQGGDFDGLVIAVQDELESPIKTMVAEETAKQVLEEVARLTGPESAEVMQVDYEVQGPAPKRRQITERRSVPELPSFSRAPRRDNLPRTHVPSGQLNQHVLGPPPPVQGSQLQAHQPRDQHAFGPPPPVQGSQPQPHQSRDRSSRDDTLLLGPPTQWPRSEEDLRKYVHSIFGDFKLPQLQWMKWEAKVRNDGLLSIRFYRNPVGPSTFIKAFNSSPRPDGWQFITASTTGSNNYSSVYTPYRLSIISWNVRGGLLLKLASDAVWSVLMKHDIALIQETHLWPKQDETIRLPKGWTIISHPRPITEATSSHQHGGLCILHRSSIPLEVIREYSTCDVVVLAIHSLILINVYIPPENSSWLSIPTTSPEKHLYNTLKALTQSILEDSDPIILLGDFNARTGDLQSASVLPERESEDHIVSPRGRRLLEALDQYNFSILNGDNTLFEQAHVSGGFTSFQANGRAVVDYAIANLAGRKIVHSFEVDRSGIDLRSDHAFLSLELEFLVYEKHSQDDQSPQHPTKTFQRNHIRESEAEAVLDEILSNTLSSIPGQKKALLLLYGPSSSHSPPLSAAIAIASTHSYEGLGFVCAIVWENQDAIKDLCSVSFAMKDIHSSHRAHLAAMVLAFKSLPPSHSASIHCISSSVIAAFGPRAYLLSQTGWSSPNGDILKAGVWALQTRQAPIKAVEVDRTDHLWVEAKKLAHRQKDLLTLAPASPLDELSSTRPQLVKSLPQEGMTPKYSWILRETEGRTSTENGSGSHRGRPSLRESASQNRRALEEAQSQAQFWDLLNEFSSAKPREPRFGIDAFVAVCIERMTKDTEAQSSYCQESLSEAERQWLSLPSSTDDTTPEGFFSNPWSLEEIDSLICHINNKPSNSATGADGRNLGYSLIVQIPSEELKILFDECLILRATPNIWLTTILVGVLKRGKSRADPNNYRIIALECCLLKCLTWLIEKRFRLWATSRRLIPKIQNGFQPGRRTNSNGFILRTAAEWASSMRKNLYVAFIDLQNAFPSVNHALLWTKVIKLGAGGPLVDVLRHLYARMSYMCRLGSSHSSEDFESDMGILAGDPCSPLLWILFIADCTFRPHQSDVLMGSSRVPALLFADDLGLISLSPDGLQLRIGEIESWCKKNALQISSTKSKGLVIRSSQQADPPFSPLIKIGGKLLRFGEHAIYVGVCFASDMRHLFSKHVENKTLHAKSAINGVYAMHNVVGDVSPKTALRIYRARVDPHMIHGCDMIVDTQDTVISEMEKEQIAFLRSVLKVNKRSFKAMLFSETGIMPIRERRVLISLESLKHYLSGPDSCGPLVYSAFRVSIDLARRGFSSWVGDLLVYLNETKLPGIPLSFGIDWLIIPENVDVLSANIRRHIGCKIYSDVLNCSRVPLLHLRAQRMLEKPDIFVREGAGINDTQDYLVALTSVTSRKALMRFLLAEHQLRCELGVWENGSLHCRLCGFPVESEVHALFICQGSPALTDIRVWLEQIRHKDCSKLPSHMNAITDEASGRRVLDQWLSNSAQAHKFWPALGRLCVIVLSVFDNL